MIFQDIVNVLLAVFYIIGDSLVNFVKKFVPDKYLFKEIKDDIVLITGGGSGIGRLMACKMAKHGATIITWDVNTKGNKETVDMIERNGGKAFAFTVDITNRESVYEFAEKMQEKIGDVTILVNNAGIVSGNYLQKTPDSKIIKTFEVNTLAHFWMIKAFLPRMITKRRGHIVTIASLAGHSGTNKLADYCSSKFAAVGLDESLRVELFVQGHSEYVKTTCVCPYFITTGMFDGVQSKFIPLLDPDDVTDKAVAGILKDQEVVFLPGWTVFLILLKIVLPAKSALRLGQALGFNCSMDQFKGRVKED